MVIDFHGLAAVKKVWMVEPIGVNFLVSDRLIKVVE